MSTDHKSTLRVLAVLELVSAQEGKYTLSEIARRLDISTSTLFPILHTLRAKKYLGYNEKTQAYTLGVRLFEIGSRIQGSQIYAQITEVMGAITEACGETCHFGVLDHGNVLYLAKVDSNEPIRMFSTIGKRLPAYGTAIGKALLKNYSLEQLQSLYPEGLKPLTANTITDFEQLYRQVNSLDIFSYEHEESNEQICCIAVPIYHEGAVAAAISVAIPIFRYNDEKRIRVERALKEFAAALEQIIPYFIY